jgi:hypothetical protein
MVLFCLRESRDIFQSENQPCHLSEVTFFRVVVAFVGFYFCLTGYCGKTIPLTRPGRCLFKLVTGCADLSSQSKGFNRGFSGFVFHFRKIALLLQLILQRDYSFVGYFILKSHWS